MQNRILTMVLVAVVAIIVGVSVVKKQSKESLINELLSRQNIMLQAQNRLEQKLTSAGAGGAVLGAQDSALMQKVSALENRLAALETQWKGVQEGMNKLKDVAAMPPMPPAEDPNKVYEIAIDHSQIRGNKAASVTIVEFVDFQCPFCARFHQPVVDVLKAYPKDVKYILKNFPLSFHENARPAAKAALAAGEQGKYWEMADALLENGAALNEEKFKELAGTIGLNVDKFMNDYKNKDAEWEKYIQSDITLGGQVNVEGTPTFYLNGKKTRARDLNSFKVEIDAILNGSK